MGTKQTTEAINKLKDQYEFAADDYLRQSGWHHTSNTPNSYWLWVKELDDGTKIMVQKSMALSMQEYFDCLAKLNNQQK